MKTPKDKKPRKPFKETRFGQWLKEHDSECFEFVAKRIPDDKPLGKAVKLALLFLAGLTDEKKKEGRTLLDQE